MMSGETVLLGADHPGTRMTIISGGLKGFYWGFLDHDGAPYTRETGYFESIEAAIEWKYMLRA